MPGVLQIEALAQVGAVAVLRQPAYQGKIAVFARIENVRFRKPVTPGDTLMLEVHLVELKGRKGKGRGIAKVGETVVSEADFTFVMVDATRQAAST
jgi:3-hydroxyacyl-[acyl-carrier-protein] dehydratase